MAQRIVALARLPAARAQQEAVPTKTRREWLRAVAALATYGAGASATEAAAVETAIVRAAGRRRE